LYNLGARKFAILNIGPRGCQPAARQSEDLRGDECDEVSLEMIKKHNSAASKAIKELESKLSGFKYSIADFYTILLDMIKHPKDYGKYIDFDNIRVLVRKQSKPHIVFHSLSFGNAQVLQCHIMRHSNKFTLITLF
jgi:hypothetical protein